MRWFGEAITHNNEDVEALWGFGTAATRLDKDLDLAEQALLAAYKRAPASAGHRHVARQPQSAAAEAGGDDSLPQGHDPLLPTSSAPGASGPRKR